MAQTIKQRGLATQTYGVQNAGTPGDLIAVDAGGFTRRPYGPALSGWTIGWSAHNSTTEARHTFTTASPENSCGLFGAWYYFGPGTVGGSNGKVELIRLTSTYGTNEVFSFIMHVGTMSIDLTSVNGLFATQTAVKVAPRHKWAWLGWAWENTTPITSVWTLKALYMELGGTLQTLYTTTNVDLNEHLISGAGCGTNSQNGATISARIGLPSLYSMASIADTAYPSEITAPVSGPNSWYVTANAAGSGKGTSADPWNAADLLTEMTANASFTVMSGYVVDASGATVDTDSLDVDVLKARYVAGTATPNGDIIYFDDSAGPIRPITTLNLTTCDGVRLLPLASLLRRYEMRGTTRIAAGSWTQDSNSIYKATLTNAYGVLFEFDSTTIADSPTGKARWLAHPTAANIAAYRTAATVGSFWSDGGGGTGPNIYVWATSGIPTTNTKVYECTTGNNLLLVSCKGALIKDSILRYAAAVDATNADGTSIGDCIKIDGNGLLIFDNCDLYAGGKHVWAIAEGGTSTKQRVVFINSTINDTRPLAYDGSSASLMVENGTTNGVDNQVYYENLLATTNTANVGSTTGSATTQLSTLQHNNGGGAFTYSKMFVKNCRLAGASGFGQVTTSLTITDNTLGISGADNIFGGSTTVLAMTGNTVTGRNLGAITTSTGSPSTVISNLFIVAGAMGPGLWSGRLYFDGNTVDYTGATAGSSSSLFTETGVLVLEMEGNAFNGGTADIAIFANGVHANESFVWDYNQYNLPAAAVIARNYNDGSTTSDRTFTAWQAIFFNNFDQHSVDNADLKLKAVSFRPNNDSPVIGAAPGITNLVGVADIGGNTRTSDAGAWVYQAGRDHGGHCVGPAIE